MAKYVKREYAIDAVLDVYYNTSDIDLSGGKFEAAILKIPVADVAPVRHGRWISNCVDSPAFFVCDQCNTVWYNDTKFCPNCGARMDGAE